MSGAHTLIPARVLTDDRLRESARIRVAQLNGCAYFLAQRSKEALRVGETQEMCLTARVSPPE
ncbi:carboxymuconolactone decarboxylase family protein [Nocardia sp. NPDC050406]|uniref:carboxymuconolactone decarboxylase family protein n=1 Tax=Nocardia sp. NPDC050406 TaxID=3364318 RepID=UPI0037B8DBF4